MSTAPVLDPLQQQQPPLMVMAQQAGYNAHSGSGSVGPVIGVLAVITVLCVIAVMIGRLCSGRRVMGYGTYDFESWVETKCASCVDGHVSPPSPPRMVAAESSAAGTGSNDAGPSAVQEEAPPKTKPEETSNQQHCQHGRAEP